VVEFRYQRIKELREGHGMTLEVMAEKMGKRKQQLAVWEGGANSPNVKNLVLLCNTFDVHPSFFFDSVSSTVEEKKAA